MKKLNVAIIGQGRSGRDIHGAFFRSESNDLFNVVAVVDALPERRERAKEEYGCDVYETYQELYDRKDIDLVVNSTFSQMHIPVTIDLLNHGFNVVCEKPFAKSYEEASYAIKAAKESGKMLNVFQQSRFAPYYTRIKEILASGVLGRPVQISIMFNGFGRRWDWQTSKAFNGGEVRNTGPHPLDQAMDLLGFPEKVNVFSRLDRVNTFGDAEDFAKILLDVPGKPLVNVEISKCNAYSPYVYLIECQYGSLRCTHTKLEYKYYNPETAPEQHQILTPLVNDKGLPAYCGEKLEWTEKEEEIKGSVFTVSVYKYYKMIYDYLTEGKPMEICPEQVLTQLKVIDQIHAQNPLTVK